MVILVRYICMKLLPNLLIYSGAYHLISSVILYLSIRLISYDTFRSQYSEGGIEAIFTITEGNYHFGLFITLIFAAAAVLKGIELKQTDEKIARLRYVTSSVLVFVVVLSAIYFTFVNLLILFNPSYF